MAVEHVDFKYKYRRDLGSDTTDFGYVQLAKNKKKSAKKKILLVLDYMPQEDLVSGRLLGGATGALLKNLLKINKEYYKEEQRLMDYDWLALSFHAFKTAGKSDSFKQDSKKEFGNRLKHVISQYKPDVVLTFGPDPYRALNQRRIEKFDGKMHHLYGVPIKTTIKAKVKGEEVKHTFKHIPTLSLNTLINDSGSGSEAALIGYTARNIQPALNGGKLKYKIPKLEYNTVFVDTMDKFKKMMKRISKAKYVAIDTETENLNRRVNKMLTIQFSCNPNEAYVLPYLHKDTPFLPKELKVIKTRLRKYFETDNTNKYLIFANATFDLNVIRNSLEVRYFKNNVWDLFGGEFALDENLKFLTGVTGGYYYSLLNLSMQYGCTAYYDAEFGKDKRKTIAQVDLDDALLEYCSLDVVIPLHIFKLQRQRALAEGYDKFESLVGQQISDMMHVFSTLEHNGCATDVEYLFYLKTKSSPIRKEIKAIEKQLAATKGVKKANKILSKKQGVPTVGLFGASNVNLFDITKKEHQYLLFFDVLKLKPINTAKNGMGKLDKKFQAKYSDKCEEVALFQKLARAKKLYNAYVKSFIKQWGEDADMRFDKRIRPHFKFLDVVTGRTSAQKPSLHQIPSRSELGKHIKRLFIAEEGRVMIKVDYSAHEVRCLSLDSYVSTESGMIQLNDLLEMEEKPRVHSFNHKSGEVELKNVGTQSIHAPPEEEDMYEIEYDGGTITVTGNHQIWSQTRNKYIRADEIQEDEELLIDG